MSRSPDIFEPYLSEMGENPIVTEWGEVLPDPALSYEEFARLLSYYDSPQPALTDVHEIPMHVLRGVKIGAEFGCWERHVYVGEDGRSRYGVVNDVSNGAVKEAAHRYMYRMLRGPIPDGKVLDHRCLNKACCWPSHVVPKTQGENTRAAREDARHRTQPRLWLPGDPLILSR